MNLILPQKNNAVMPQPISVLSFFTGAGFLDMGFIQAGFNVVWHNEYFSPFVKGFEYGMKKLYGEGHWAEIQNTTSIADVTSNQIISETFTNNLLPDLFGIIGGPPCPDFSVAGNNLGRDGTHGQLSQVYVDRILEIKPTFFLFENVPGLLRTKQHRDFLSEMLTALSIKYEIDIETLNALDYGVPQDRERIFIIGINRDWLNDYHYPIFGSQNIKWENLLESRRKTPFANLQANLLLYETLDNYPKSWFPWPTNPTYINSKINLTWPDIVIPPQEVLKPEGIPDQIMVHNYICDQDELSLLENSSDQFTPHSSKFSWIKEGDVHRKSFKRLHRYRYSPSVAYGNNEVHLHPIEKRRLSVREAMRLQTVPDKYALPEDMTLTNKFKTVGNGVPVKLAYEVSCAIMRFLEGVTNGDF